MDRISYLSTLPFLIPLQSKSWPPVVHIMNNPTTATTNAGTTSTTTSTRSSQIILGVPSKKTSDYYSYRSGNGGGGGGLNSAAAITNITTAPVAPIPFVVSMELVSSHNNNTKKNDDDDDDRHCVMYFSTTCKTALTEEEEMADVKNKNTKELDPTLTTIEIAVVQVPQPSSTSTTGTTTTGTNSSNDTLTQVYIRIQEEHVFFFNTQYCHCFYTTQATKTTPSTNPNIKDRNNAVDQPQCLILQFQNTNIQFRIFPWPLQHRDENISINNDDEDVTEIFQQVMKIFDSCRRQSRSIFPTKMEISQEYRLSIPYDNDDDATRTNPNQNSSSTTTTAESSPMLHNHQLDVVVAVVDDDQIITKEAHHPTSVMNSTVERKSPPNANAKEHTTSSSESPPNSSKMLQRYLQVRNQSLSSLDSIRHILHLPISTIPTKLRNSDSHDNDDDDEEDYGSSHNNNNERSGSGCDNHHHDNSLDGPIRLTKASLPTLLNSVARQMSQSYIVSSDMDRPTSIQSEYDTLLRQLQHEQMNTVMNAYFLPSSLQHPHRHKRRKLQQQQQQTLSAAMLSSSIKSSRDDAIASPAATATTMIMPIATPSDVTINTMTTLMTEQKRLIQERYQLMLLPSRG